MRYVYLATFLVVVLAVSVLGMRGTRFSHPPLELFPDMNHQAHLKPMAASSLFADGRADRPIPPHTVAAGTPLDDDDALYRGQAADGSFVTSIPKTIKVDASLLARGQDRFTVYCQPCHGALGDGNGITKQYGMTATPSYTDERRLKLTVGELFNTITNGSVKTPEGKQNMLPYADKLAVQDRWAVVAYVRALQRAQTGKLADVPADHLKDLP
jgi:mono/diheme cytochrome c family protein